jgi:DNA-binding transcriptional regulator PaaX
MILLMGAIEHKARKRRVKEDIQSVVLNVVAVGGVIAVSLVAPNAVQLLRFGKDRRSLFRVNTAFNRLIDRKLVEIKGSGERRFVRLTEAGMRALTFEKARMLTRSREHRRWDGQWRMVMFDIPEHRRATRMRLYALMREIGFFKLQQSVWIYPYDCEELIQLIKAELRAGYSVLYGVVRALEGDGMARKHFRLNQSQ